MARSTPVNTSSEPYDFDRDSAVRGTRPQGAGSGKRRRATFSRTSASPARATSSSARRSICWAATALVAFARIFSPWARSCSALRKAPSRSLRRLRSSSSRCSR